MTTITGFNKHYHFTSCNNQDCNTDRLNTINENIEVLSKKINPYEGPTYANVPSFWNIFFAPRDFISSLYSLGKARLYGDAESQFDAKLRLLGIPFAFASGSLDTANLVNQFFTLLRLSYQSPLFKVMTVISKIVSIPLCLIEGLFEYVSIKRQNRFVKRFPFPQLSIPDFTSVSSETAKRELLNSWIKKLDPKSSEYTTVFGEERFHRVHTLLKESAQRTDPASPSPKQWEHLTTLAKQVQERGILHYLEKLHKAYFSLSAEEMGQVEHYISRHLPYLDYEQRVATQKGITNVLINSKIMKLSQRVRPWLAKEIEQQLAPILSDLRHDDPQVRLSAQTRAMDLFNNIDIQTRKKLIVHRIGLAALGFTLVGVIAALIACPYLIPVIIIGAGSILSIGKSLAFHGLLDSRGWQFNWSNCVPDRLKSLYKRIREAYISSHIHD